MTETGWGEFAIAITITFHDASGLSPITLQHTLKLFPGPNLQPSIKKPVRTDAAHLGTARGISRGCQTRRASHSWIFLRFLPVCVFSLR